MPEELEVHRFPHQPGDESSEVDTPLYSNGESFPDDRHGALVEVAERTRRGLPRDPPADEPSRVASLLHRDLRDTRERPSLLPEYGRVNAPMFRLLVGAGTGAG